MTYTEAYNQYEAIIAKAEDDRIIKKSYFAVLGAFKSTLLSLAEAEKIAELNQSKE